MRAILIILRTPIAIVILPFVFALMAARVALAFFACLLLFAPLAFLAFIASGEWRINPFEFFQKEAALAGESIAMLFKFWAGEKNWHERKIR